MVKFFEQLFFRFSPFNRSYRHVSGPFKRHSKNLAPPPPHLNIWPDFGLGKNLAPPPGASWRKTTVLPGAVKQTLSEMEMRERQDE
jgi:hypothetical protein